MVVPHAVQEDPKCASAADEEGPPPPVIILIPMNVSGYYSYLDDGDYILLKTKSNSTNITMKGTNPASRTVKMLLMYHGCTGIWREMSVNKWQLDKKPQSSESDERAKRKGRARSLGPYEKIENKNGSKKQAWN
ncbi:hypothetical protein MMC16_001437 [Acarospora aff. strigata]|nr:hypothetical protein [Acarospora aff. strigata]